MHACVTLAPVRFPTGERHSSLGRSVQSQERGPALPWWFFPGVGFMSSVAAVWAYDSVACGSVLEGALSTLITLCIYVFVRVDVLIVVLLVFATSAGAGVALSRHRPLREKRELLMFLMPVAWLLIGLAAGMSGAMPMECSLGPWNR